MFQRLVAEVSRHPHRWYTIRDLAREVGVKEDRVREFIEMAGLGGLEVELGTKSDSEARSWEPGVELIYRFTREEV